MRAGDESCNKSFHLMVVDVLFNTVLTLAIDLVQDNVTMIERLNVIKFNFQISFSDITDNVNLCWIDQESQILMVNLNYYALQSNEISILHYNPSTISSIISIYLPWFSLICSNETQSNLCHLYIENSFEHKNCKHRVLLEVKEIHSRLKEFKIMFYNMHVGNFLNLRKKSENVEITVRKKSKSRQRRKKNEEF